MSRSASASVEDDPEAFPRPFGQYLLLENFARGGMGEVYLAKIGGIAGLERYCVLKKLRSELTRDREYVTRFIDEARVVVTLNHANICHVFDVGLVGQEYYLAMEYISGRDVRTIQDRCRTKEKAMHAASALHLVCETLEALDYAHRRNHPLTGEPLNLVHRDVSPQNVLVSYEGEVKLIDFGLAASRLKVERTQPNVVMGKMAYMAPEQARGDPIDARADLFACGVLAYELISGERFYEGMTANDIWQVAGKGGFIPRKWDQIDRELAKHLSRALHPDAKKRFASCGDFREALASHLHWRFPGTGVRGLRDMLSDIFSEELRREREMLAKFGTVTVAGFRTEFEGTKSQSISLARADDDEASQASPKAATLVRNEQSASGTLMPPPNSSASGKRDVHQDPTRLAAAPTSRDRTEQQNKARSTDEEPVGSATVVRPDVPQPEHTQRVARASSRSLSSGERIVDDRTALAVDGPFERSSSRNRVVPAAAAAVMVVVAAYFIREAYSTSTNSAEETPHLATPPVVTPPTPPAPTAADDVALEVLDPKGTTAKDATAKDDASNAGKDNAGKDSNASNTAKDSNASNSNASNSNASNSNASKDSAGNTSKDNAREGKERDRDRDRGKQRNNTGKHNEKAAETAPVVTPVATPVKPPDPPEKTKDDRIRAANAGLKEFGQCAFALKGARVDANNLDEVEACLRKYKH